MPTQRICGGASGASIRIVGVGAGLGFALEAGVGLALETGVGLGSGVPATPARSKQAAANTARMRERFEARAAFLPNQRR